VEYHPSRRVRTAAMQIGDFLIHGDRGYLLCGFDPEGVLPRMVYVEDVVTGARSTLPFDEVTLGARQPSDLRLVNPSLKEPGSDQLP
jgi:hypothetical protein